MGICADIDWLNISSAYIITIMRRSLLLICVSLIVGFLFGSSKNGLPQTKTEPDGNLHPEIVRFFSEPVQGTLSVELDPAYGSTVVDAEPIWSLPEKPDDELPTGNLNGFKVFDENEGWNGDPLYPQFDNPKNSPDWETKDIDIDGDGKTEQIMINSLAMTSQPHLIRIAKNDMVVFEYAGSVVDVEETYGNEDWGKEMYLPGFILTTQVWQDRNGLRVRYVIDEDGTIRPLWQQRHAGIEL